MKLLLQYLKPYKWLVALALLLAAINQTFSLFDPMIFGKLIDQYGMHVKIAADGTTRTESQYINGIMFMLLLLVGTAMVSRIAKAFQDYVVNVIIQKFGARIFTDGLKHSMRLPYQEFEDQRSGETLSILTKVRADTEKFIGYVINVLFSIIVSVIFVSIYATRLHWSIIPIYLGGALLIAFVTNLLSKKIKTIQKKIVKETTSLAGSTTESLRNIELVKSLGLTNQEVSRLNTNTYKILGLELKKSEEHPFAQFHTGHHGEFIATGNHFHPHVADLQTGAHRWAIDIITVLQLLHLWSVAGNWQYHHELS